MRLPIDTNAVRFAAGGPPTPVIDFETRMQRVDEAGQPLFNVDLFASAEDVHDTVKVKVAGEPKGLSEFTIVKVTGLVATTWEIGDKHGVSFRAERIEPLSKATQA